MPEGVEARIYVAMSPGARFAQGEVVAGLIERVAVRAGEGFGIHEITHPYAVIVTQDCDLEQDERAHNASTPSPLQNILLVVAEEAAVAIAGMTAGDIRKRAKQNKEERYHFLSEVPKSADGDSSGIPALVLDFKRVFSCPTTLLRDAIASGEIRHRTRLETPYAEHLSVRFGFFFQRIGLLVDHHRVPETPPAQNMPALSPVPSPTRD